MPYEIPDFRVGRQVTDGRPTPTDPFHVTVVTHDEIDAFLGVLPAERTDRLRALRDLGILVHRPRRLTQEVRRADGTRTREYVFRGRPSDVPRRKQRPDRRVARW